MKATPGAGEQENTENYHQQTKYQENGDDMEKEYHQEYFMKPQYEQYPQEWQPMWKDTPPHKTPELGKLGNTQTHLVKESTTSGPEKMTGNERNKQDWQSSRICAYGPQK